MKAFSDFVAEQHVDHKGNPITMQDIRLMAGEGNLATYNLFIIFES